MSNEQNDTLVSDAYRELAGETTPPELDERIMAMAEAAARPVKSLFPMWMRPVAWAATAVLAVAIVFQSMNVPESPAPVAAPPSAPKPAESIEEAFAPQDADLLEEAEELARARSGPDREQRLRKSQEITFDQATAGNSVAGDVDPVAETSAVREPAPESADVAGLASTSSLRQEKKELDDTIVCDDAARTTANDWFACVTDLRDAGRVEDADNEMRALLQQFPEFRPSR